MVPPTLPAEIFLHPNFGMTMHFDGAGAGLSGIDITGSNLIGAGDGTGSDLFGEDSSGTVRA